MNKHDKQVIESQLEDEKAVLKDLERQYKRALADINERIKILQADDSPSRAYQADYQKTLKAQVEAILEKLHADEYDSIHKYLSNSYTSGYVGTMYAMGRKNGIHVITPLDQKAAAKAIVTDSKLSTDLYGALGYDLNKLKKHVREEITRGIATSLPYEQIARNISGYTNMPLSNANRIVRTEGHRIQQASADDARNAAKARGADVVKQWDSSLDGATRPLHRKLDGQIREVDEPFEAGGKKVMYPGKFGDPSQDCNCRCVALTRARWALDEKELKTLKERAKFFDLDKTKDFDEYKKKYLKASKTIEKPGKSGIIKGRKTNLQLFAELTKHAEERREQRSVTDDEIDDALEVPLFVAGVVTDDQGRKSVKHIGKYATVIINPDNGIVITSWRTGTKIRKKYEKED
ncbi:MAG: hypothetical protein J6V25_02095 [Oscillospiraceae bacterium]|nr:hypothetical protein [Oscillospiraceae bacterium]